MSFYTTNFARRQMLGRSVGEFGGINMRPELTPAHSIQSHLWAAHMQGGGEVHLGPYDFQIQSKATSDEDADTLNYLYVPPDVTLIGVPHKTRIYKDVNYFEAYGSNTVNPKSLGPVVYLDGPRAAMIDCEVDLDTDSNLPDGATTTGVSVGRKYKVTLGGVTYESDAYRNPFTENQSDCIVYVAGAWNRVQNCWVGAPYKLPDDSHPPVRQMRGIYVASTGTTSNIISGNNLRTLSESQTEGIFLIDGSKGSAITGNVAEYGDTHAVSVLTADAAHNAITGNVGATTSR